MSGTVKPRHSACSKHYGCCFCFIAFFSVASLLTMISRIQSSCKNGVKFEDAMSQALSEILQNLQVSNKDAKKPICRKASVPAIWYSTVGATEKRATHFKQSRKVLERRFSEITTSDLSTMPALQSLEEEKVNTEQVDIGLEDRVVEEVSARAEKQKEDTDIQSRGLISAPVGGTSKATTLEQPKKEMERKLSVFTASALTAMASLQPLEEEEVDIDKVDVSLGCQDKVIQEVSAEKKNEDEDIQPRGLNSAPVGETSETTTLEKPKKEMERKMSVFIAPALTAMASLQSPEEEEINTDKVDISLGCQDKEVSAEKKNEDEDIQARGLISSPAVRETSETTTRLMQPKKKMKRKFSVFLTAPALSKTSSLQSLDEEKVNIDEVDIGLGENYNVTQKVKSDKKKECVDVQLRRRISAPVIGRTSETRILEHLKKEMTSAASVLSAMPSLQSLNEEINIDKVSIGLGFQDKGIEEGSTQKQREHEDNQPIRRKISAPVMGGSDTTSLKQLKKKIKRKFSVFVAPALSATSSLQSLNEEKVDIDRADISLEYQEKIIQEVSAEQQRERADIQRRRRRTSAPAFGTSETKPPQQPKKKMRRKFSLFPSPALSAAPSLQSLDEEKVSIDEVDIGFVYNDKAINKDTKKQHKRRRVSAPARTYRETAETTPFKQPKNDLIRKISRSTFLPDAVALPSMPWLADCFEDQLEADFEPVEFDLSFLDDLMKSV